MKSWFCGIGLLLLASLGLSTQQTLHAQSNGPAGGAAYLQLQGELLGEVSEQDLAMVTSSVPDSVETLRRAGRTILSQVDALLAAARAANPGRDRYRAYRLFARALGWAWGEDQVEHYEVAASFNVVLNQAIFTGGEKITITMKPLFTLGHPLTSTCIAESWLETETGVVPGTEQRLSIAALAPCHFDHPTEGLPDGAIAVGYRLRSPGGKRLAERRYAVLIAKDVQDRATRLRARFDAAKPSNVSGASPACRTALETIDYCLRNLELERTKFDGHWARTSHPFGMSGNLTQAALGAAAETPFPRFTGRIRYPDDFVLAESLAEALRADPDVLRTRSGDMALAIRSTSDSMLLHFRLFVPAGDGPARRRALVIALHSGEGDSGYFDWPVFKAPNEKTLQQLAEERGFIVAIPNGERGFNNARGERDLFDLMDRLHAVYSIEPKRTFLLGWSLGGEAAWRVAMKYPGRFAALTSITGAADWLNRQNTQMANALPVLQCEPQQDQSGGRRQRTSVQAAALLHDFTRKSYPGTDHVSVWARSLPDVFDFFEGHLVVDGIPTTRP